MIKPWPFYMTAVQGHDTTSKQWHFYMTVVQGHDATIKPQLVNATTFQGKVTMPQSNVTPTILYTTSFQVHFIKT